METLNTAEWIDIAGIASFMAMLAYVAVLLLRFIRKYMAVGERHYAFYEQPDFNCAYGRKRVISRVIHNRKHAVFAINPGSRAGLSGK